MTQTSDRRALLVLENFIGGKFVPCGVHLDSYDPATGAVYCRVPDSGEEEVRGCVFSRSSVGRVAAQVDHSFTSFSSLLIFNPFTLA